MLNEKKLSFNEYKFHVKDSLIKIGLDIKSAEVVADYMATTDFFGVKSHGVAILKAHIEKIRSGAYNLTPDFRVIKEFPSFAVIDGDNSIGMVSAKYCVDYAIEKAKESGVFTVFSRNNNTLGSAFYYSLKAAERGCIAIVATNSPAQMAPVGGTEKMLGTNPFSISIPAREKFPIIIDMATSVVAKSKFKEYKKKGLELPEGWALDKNGAPTTDPDEAMGGLVLPMAGFKGYGISLMIDALSGLLSGASFLDGVGRFYSADNSGMNVGYVFTIMNPALIYGDEFYAQVDEYISHIRSSSTISGEKIILPGDDRLALFERNMQEGLEWTESL